MLLTIFSMQHLLGGCIGFTIVASYGARVLKKIKTYNHKHHIVEWYKGEDVLFDLPFCDEERGTGMTGAEYLDVTTLPYD